MKSCLIRELTFTTSLNKNKIKILVADQQFWGPLYMLYVFANPTEQFRETGWYFGFFLDALPYGVSCLPLFSLSTGQSLSKPLSEWILMTYQPTCPCCCLLSATSAGICPLWVICLWKWEEPENGKILCSLQENLFTLSILQTSHVNRFKYATVCLWSFAFWVTHMWAWKRERQRKWQTDK